MKNTKLELIELMESLGAKPQAHGDYIVWELDSRDFKKEQATSDKQQATGTSNRCNEKNKKGGTRPHAHPGCDKLSQGPSATVRQIVACDNFFLDVSFRQQVM